MDLRFSWGYKKFSICRSLAYLFDLLVQSKELLDTWRSDVTSHRRLPIGSVPRLSVVRVSVRPCFGCRRFALRTNEFGLVPLQGSPSYVKWSMCGGGIRWRCGRMDVGENGLFSAITRPQCHLDVSMLLSSL